MEEAVLAATQASIRDEQASYIKRFALSFSCFNLPNLDEHQDASTSDPYIELLKMRDEDGEWTKIGETEVIHDNVNPQFVRKIVVEYNFEKECHYSLNVYDSDENS